MAIVQRIEYLSSNSKLRVRISYYAFYFNSAFYLFDLLYLKHILKIRVATQPGEPGKVREFEFRIRGKIEKIEGISAFYPKFWKSHGI